MLREKCEVIAESLESVLGGGNSGSFGGTGFSSNKVPFGGDVNGGNNGSFGAGAISSNKVPLGDIKLDDNKDDW